MPLQSTYLRERRALGRALRSLREDAGLSGNRFAKQLGWAQSKVSRIETALQVPTKEDIDQWVAELGLPDGTLGSLLVLLDRARAEYTSWKVSYSIAGGADKKQEQLLFLERQSRSLRSFQPALIPGLLQTADYIKEVLSLPSGPARFGASLNDVAEMVKVRLQRQSILYDSDKSIHILMLEAALHVGVCRKSTLLAQLDRLISLLQVPTFNIGIVPLAAPLPMFLLGGFDLFDDDLAVVETLTGEQQISEPTEVKLYQDCFASLSSVAFRGNQAQVLVERAKERVAEEGVEEREIWPEHDA